MWSHEERIEIAASASRIWALLSDVPGWKRWNAGIETIRIHGPFVAGTRFTMQPPGQEAFESQLLDVRPGEVFTDETIIDGNRIVVHHRIKALSEHRCQVTYATEIEGPDAEAFGPPVTGDFPDVLAALKQLAESDD
ncbi:SRPBCC family protein [Niveibacterium sp. SC-1]|uniref:SRPBCC family protein n=1 Tax=Niveibacterium sp. SC-1 TaxID=3135646 RepID=UPI00311F9629